MILVTGDSGFIGKWITFTLRTDEGEIAVGYDIEDGLDIRDKFSLYKVFNEHNIDTVIHLAARAGVRTSKYFPDEYISTNIQGTKNVLDVAEMFGVKHVIFFSSSSVYGSQTPPNSESQPLNPESLYAITKATGEMLCQASPVPTTVIRPFTVYGLHGRNDQVIYKWLNQIKAGKPITVFGDGTTKRGYTHVQDLVEGVIKVWKSGAPQSGHEVYNLGGDEVIELRQLIEIFKESKEITIENRDLPQGDVVENWADISKAKKALHWEPVRHFKDEVLNIITNNS